MRANPENSMAPIMAHGANSLKSIFYALAANGSIAIAKGVAAWITGSGAMLAEAIHSTADCANQGLLLIGLKKAKRPPSEDYPLGYGKEIYFWSFLVAIFLFSMGGLFSVYEGWHKLHDPEPLRQPWIAVGVLIFAILAEGLSLAGCIREINKIRPPGQSLWRWFRDTRESDLMVVLGEDIAALFGLLFALIALLAAIATGDPFYDALGSIAIGLLLIVVAVLVGTEVKALLVGQGVEPRVKANMLNWLAERAEIDKVFNIVTLRMGSDVMVAVKASLIECEHSAALMIERINAVEAAFKETFPNVLWLFFEPDNED
jgi:cation diffusion facilitator family transporter